uniref:Uncharacterized protein n=1 Tax=Fagus sylvatica TaxID=28930 RepID=A0A2N9GY86_FAGSY
MEQVEGEPPISKLFSIKRGKKKKKNNNNKEKDDVPVDSVNAENPSGSSEDCNGNRVNVSEFDYDVENHFRAMETISKLCGETEEEEEEDDALQETEIHRFSSSVTFLREWKYFNYEPRTVRFACEVGSLEGKDVGIKLSQFSSANVPKKEGPSGGATSVESRSCCSKDFVMYVGGHVWALDWCPRIHTPDNHFKCEFIAVAAHPPGSSYHKIGAPLTGRGVIQIWCILNVSMNEEEVPASIEKSTLSKRPRGRPRKKPIEDNEAITTQSKRPRGRPRKNPIEESLDNLNCIDQHVQALAVQLPEDASEAHAVDGVPRDAHEHAVQEDGDKKSHSGSLGISSGSFSISKDVALPRVLLCLAHNGKVAWDVKWRPSSACESKCKHRMGYLAVLLGSGSLEVWEVPLPRTMKVIYSSVHQEGTDPRFVKLEPVFRCSMLKCGGIQSIPLTVEWSASPPHEYLLAGCHDGTVALWKFSASCSSKDTRPLLCFSADTVPIRALSWAPLESDPEISNVIVTAGHGGLKFWDLRDPFRPLWELHPVPRNIYSLDWLPDPRCVILSFDDGTMRTLSLVKAAYDVPVTGKPFVGTKPGLHSYYCSSFAIWSVQVSRLTGMVAYCSADGTVLRFQLTSKAVDKDHSRNRTPHFLCGSLTEEESAITINTPLPNTPCPLKKSLNKSGDTPLSMREFSSETQQMKRAKDKMAKGPNTEAQTLALCYGNGSGTESEPEEVLTYPKSKKRPNCRSSNKNNPEDDQALVCKDEEPPKMQGKENGKVEAQTREVFPSKMVAMHTVRWNMNKGSERWLCYGGAAGLVRCQEIVLSDVDRKLAMKR